MDLLIKLFDAALGTALDVLPIAVILAFFQILILRRTIPNLKRVLAGFLFVLAGLTLFLVGLEEALFPLGRAMAKQLTDPAFIGVDIASGAAIWTDYFWVYVFAASIGFATTVAEPALIAVSVKAEEISAGSIHAFGLRMAVAVGVAAGVSLGAFRIVTGDALYIYIIAGYVVVIIQTMTAGGEGRMIIPLAYDSGGVTTSTVTVPIVTALGLGLASTVPGRSPIIDGFGLIAFASLFPIMSVLAYARISSWMRVRRKKLSQTKNGQIISNHAQEER